MGNTKLDGNRGGPAVIRNDLLVTSYANTDVVVSKGEKTYTKTTDANGKVLFKGLTPGDWTVSISDGSKSVSRKFTVEPEYSTELQFFTSIITVTYPEGSSCTVTYGSITTDAPDTSGTWAYTARGAGTYVFSCTNGEDTVTRSVEITYDDQNENLQLTYFAATINVSYPAGYTCTATYGGSTFTAPDTNGTWTITAIEPGTWSFCLDGGTTETVTVTTNGEEVTQNKWYLYNNGVDNTALTGGLTTSGYSEAANLWSFNNTNISVYTNTGDVDVFGTTNKIHMANVQSGYVRMSSTMNKWDNYFGVSESKSGSGYIARTQISGTGDITAAFDAIDVTVDGYVYFLATASSQLEIYEIWLEC